MMRRGRVNPTCKCCNIADDPGWRTREKNEWTKEVEEEMTDNFGFLNDREEAFINAFKEGIRREERERHKDTYWNGVDRGIQIERERIIALLETMNCHGDTAIQCGCGSYWEAIALIKGENE